MNKKLLVGIISAAAGVIAASAISYFVKKKLDKRSSKEETKDDNNIVELKEEETSDKNHKKTDIFANDDSYAHVINNASGLTNNTSDNKKYIYYSSVVSNAPSDGNKYRDLVDSILRESSMRAERDEAPVEEEVKRTNRNTQANSASKKKNAGAKMTNFAVIEKINEVDYDSDDSENDIMTLTYFRGNNKLVNSELELVEDPKQILGKYYKNLSEYDDDFVYFRNHVLGLDIEVAFEDDEFVYEYDYDEDSV